MEQQETKLPLEWLSSRRTPELHRLEALCRENAREERCAQRRLQEVEEAMAPEPERSCPAPAPEAVERAKLEQLRRQLNAMIGEELTAPLTLNALPGVTAEQLAAMDVEKDLEKAKAASYDLYAAKLTLEDADEEYKDKAGDLGYNKDNYEYIAVKHQWQAAQYTYNAAVQNFELSFRSLYDSVQSYASALNAAKVSLECERSDLAAAQLRYDQGTISENALHTAEDELYTAQDTVSGAERDLFTAYNNYRWAVDYGLLAG